MEDTQKAEEKVVETETTQVAPPVTKESATEAQTMDKEPIDQGSLTEGESEFPADEQERRRAFQEMRQEIKRLREERVTREKRESAFNQFRAQTPPVGQPVELRIEDFTNPVTGETDYAAYNRAQNEVINRRVNQTASFVAQQTTSEMIDENNARTKYPELFADSEIEQEIADRWLASKLRGENASISDVASRIAKRYKQTLSKAEKVGEERALTEVSEKEKAGLSVSGQTSEPARQESVKEDFERLQKQTRMGNDEAITARISKIPWANK